MGSSSVGCARGKVGAGKDGRPSHFIIIIIVNIWEREHGSCSTSGVCPPTVLGGGKGRDSYAQGLEAKDAERVQKES